MADLSGVSETLPVRIAGVGAGTGLPDNWMDVDSSGRVSVKLYDAAGNAITSTLLGAKQSVDVNVTATAPPTNLLSTGTLSGLGQTVNLTLQGTASVNIDVSGSGFVGTIVVIENTPSQSRVLGVFNGNSSPIAANITANGNYRVVGLATSSTLTVQFSAYTSGSATINIYGSTAPFIVMPYSANAANVLVTSYLNDGVGSALTSTTINSKQRLDVDSVSEGVDGTTAPFYATAVGGKDGSGNLQTILTDTLGNQAILVKDSSGNGINSYNSQLDTADIINTGLSSGSITVGTTSIAARVSASNLANRKMLMIAPVSYTVYLGATSGVTTATGIPIYPGQVISFAFSANVTPYLISATSGTVNIFEAS
jgi:hypothetical protein